MRRRWRRCYGDRPVLLLRLPNHIVLDPDSPEANALIVRLVCEGRIPATT